MVGSCLAHDQPVSATAVGLTVHTYRTDVCVRSMYREHKFSRIICMDGRVHAGREWMHGVDPPLEVENICTRLRLVSPLVIPSSLNPRSVSRGRLEDEI